MKTYKPHFHIKKEKEQPNLITKEFVEKYSYLGRSFDRMGIQHACKFKAKNVSSIKLAKAFACDYFNILSENPTFTFEEFDFLISMISNKVPIEQQQKDNSWYKDYRKDLYEFFGISHLYVDYFRQYRDNFENLFGGVK